MTTMEEDFCEHLCDGLMPWCEECHTMENLVDWSKYKILFKGHPLLEMKMPIILCVKCKDKNIKEYMTEKK